MARVCTLLLALAAITALAPAPAVADGDPASDVLLTDTVFLPYDAPSEATATKLRRVVDAARKGGQPVRVAVISSPQDLGSVTSLYGHPVEYARLLSQELGNPIEPGAEGHREELIVVMHAGFGTANVPPEVDRALRSIEIDPNADPDALTAAAGYGVQELAEATGRPVEAAFDKPAGGGGGGGALTAVLVVLALLALGGLLFFLRARSVRTEAQSPGGNT